MNFIDNIINSAKEKKKRIILPESLDERVLKATEILSKENIAEILLLGRKENILKKAEELSLVFNDNVKIIEYLETSNNEKFEKIAEKFCEIRKNKNLQISEAKEILKNEVYYAMMLLEIGEADGVVAGAVYPTKDILKPALQIIKTKKESKLISSYFLMDIRNEKYGENGIILMSDCGLNIEPSAEELSSIAIDSAHTFEKIVKKEAKVAFLSFSSFGSASSSSVEKVRKAVEITKLNAPKIVSDGEMQLDTAIVKEVALKKAKESKVAGQANVLIFPNLDAGNIGYKMAQYMSGGRAYGPLLQGIKKPVNDLSRGTTTEEIVGVVALTAVQAEE